MSEPTLIIKLGAAGDVVRTTTLLHRLRGPVTWVTHFPELLTGIAPDLRVVSWQQRRQALDRDYGLIVNLEEDVSAADFVGQVSRRELHGAYLSRAGELRYTESSSRWFDLSLVSVLGRAGANALKLSNRSTYQDLVFAGLGWPFVGEPYLLPTGGDSSLRGDVAIATGSGPRWPAKQWAGFPQLKPSLERLGLVVNELPQRPTLREHIADIRNHRCLVSGDTLPMHVALGTSTPCVTLFTCTSPWEIHGYGVQSKVVSSRLAEFFYSRDVSPEASTAIPVEAVTAAVLERLGAVPA